MAFASSHSILYHRTTSLAKKLRAAGTNANPITNRKTWHSHCGDTGQKAMATLNVFAQERMNTPSSHLRIGSGHRRHDRAIYSDATTNIVPSVLVTPPPPTPPLLLEGDEMFISPAGKCHTVYRLEETPNDVHNRCRDILLEEKYDIEGARKKISLFGPPTLLNEDLDKDLEDSNSNQLTDIFSFDLQEINHGVQNGSGTGSMSWDSSIVMGLYFAVNPDELRGNVLELGSGVGLGGILSNVATNFIHDDTSATAQRSVTLTDVNDDVLNVLQQNMNAAAFKDGICIQKLDWFDFLGDLQTSPNASLKDSERYDTIIASDCAYLHSQITPLSETISKLLGSEGRGKLHMFAPYNRGVVHELIEDLHEKNMHVHLEELEMSKYRTKQDGGRVTVSAFRGRYWNDGSKSLNDDMTCRVSKFLHITAWHKTRLEIADEVCRVQDQMTDID